MITIDSEVHWILLGARQGECEILRLLELRFYEVGLLDLCFCDASLLDVWLVDVTVSEETVALETLRSAVVSIRLRHLLKAYIKLQCGLHAASRCWSRRVASDLNTLAQEGQSNESD
jgi:hypothetical protein